MTTKKKSDAGADEMRVEYDLGALSGGVRGKYYDQVQAGTNLVVLDADVAEAFASSQEVNAALRMLVSLAGRTAGSGS